MNQNKKETTDKISRSRRRIYDAPSEPETIETKKDMKVSSNEVAGVPALKTDIPTEVQETEGARLVKADKIVRRYMIMAGGVGLIPSMILDITSLTAALVSMISELGDLYDIPAEQLRDKPLIIAAAGSLVTQGILHTKLLLAIKAIPLIGQLSSFFFYPAIASALTYAVGKTFTSHFEEGRTLEDFSVAKVKDQFKRYMKSAPESV